MVQWIIIRDEFGFEEGPTEWSFVGYPSTGENIKDLLLEDALIILTRSPMNVVINLTDTYHSSNQRDMRHEKVLGTEHQTEEHLYEPSLFRIDDKVWLHIRGIFSSRDY